jgi:cell migration-inducing and hyaluronan-binding protein
MRKPLRLLKPVLLLSCGLALGMGSSAQAQSLWSDASTWPSGKVPSEGDAVEITSDMDVVLDVSPPALRSLTIAGKLSFSDESDLDLVTEWIYVPGGELTIGTADNPHSSKATITLTDNIEGEDINTMGDRGIMLMRGTLNLHGTRDHTWSKLSATAERGATSIQLLNASGWHVGDEIVLASTDFNPRQAERRTITAVNGNTVSFAEPLEYMHFGEITFGVDERGEVGNLTRNIVIQASEDAAETYFGGHIMAMSGSQMHIDSIELNRMGQHLTLARYPVHFHVLGEGTGQYVRNTAIHDTFNRCVTMHGTNNLQVENNVTYNTVGHCFFMEDGIEQGNRIAYNLGIQTMCHPTLPCEPTNLGIPGERGNGQQSENVLLPSDNTVATYWITNPSNDYIGNVAAGSDSTGFWMSLPEHPNGQFEGTEIAANTWPRRMPAGEFRGNVAHSNFDGMMFDRNINQDNTFGVTGSSHIARQDPSDPNSPSIESLVEDFTAYKNRNGGIWARGEMKVFRNLRLADNAIGYTHASGSIGRDPFTSRVVDSLFVGETDNIGNPATVAEIAYGRSLPKHVADYPIRGYEFYDFLHHVENTHFVNYADNATRDAGAISYLLYTSFGMSTENSVEGVTFENAKPVHFPEEVRRWSNDFGGRAAYATATIHDIDGSITGTPDSYIVNDNGIAASDDSCEIMPRWGAAVCRGDVGRFSLGGGFGFFGPSGDPVILTRNNRRWEYNGQGTVSSGATVRIDTARETLDLSLNEMDENSWVIFQLPGFASAKGGQAADNLDALRASSETAYFKADDALWVKLVADAAPEGETVGIRSPQASLAVSKTSLGG